VPASSRSAQNSRQNNRQINFAGRHAFAHAIKFARCGFHLRNRPIAEAFSRDNE
jgi:hypothetical protein